MIGLALPMWTEVARSVPTGRGHKTAGPGLPQVCGSGCFCLQLLAQQITPCVRRWPRTGWGQPGACWCVIVGECWAQVGTHCQELVCDASDMASGILTGQTLIRTQQVWKGGDGRGSGVRPPNPARCFLQVSPHSRTQAVFSRHAVCQSESPGASPEPRPAGSAGLVAFCPVSSGTCQARYPLPCTWSLHMAGNNRSRAFLPRGGEGQGARSAASCQEPLAGVSGQPEVPRKPG